MLESRIADICKNMDDLGKSEAANPSDREVFERLMFTKASEHEVKNSLKTLMRMMNAVYGKNTILLIDEYDVPIHHAGEKDTGENRYYERMLDMMRGIMGTALKDNEFLQFAVVTGCLRIAKESIFTGTNNFASYSVLDNRFSDYFGFTEEEVGAMLGSAGKADKAAIIKEWYDGYVFGKAHIYCPWDVINYLSELRQDRDARPKSYWKNTSHNGVLLTLARKNSFSVREKFEALLNGGAVVQTISDTLTYDKLESTEDSLWSTLLMTGYLTKADPLEDGDAGYLTKTDPPEDGDAGYQTKADPPEDGDAVRLRIPNKEIATIFRDSVVTLFKETIDTAKQKAMMDALWEGKAAEAGSALSDLLWDTISYNDYHEDYYHAFLTGVFVGLGYAVDSNKEKGLGRPDILLKDPGHRRALIIEAKKSKSDSDMERDCERAISQIQGMKYAESLYGYREIKCYGVAFFRKEAKVMSL